MRAPMEVGDVFRVKFESADFVGVVSKIEDVFIYYQVIAGADYGRPQCMCGSAFERRMKKVGHAS